MTTSQLLITIKTHSRFPKDLKRFSTLPAGLLITTLVVGCASTSPIVRISKTTSDAKCSISMAISNRYPRDVQGNYLDIALLSKSGAIIDRMKGTFNDRLFQSGYTNTISLNTRARCEDVEGIKVYTLSFANPSTGLFPGHGDYHLELVGFTLNNSK